MLTGFGVWEFQTIQNKPQVGAFLSIPDIQKFESLEDLGWLLVIKGDQTLSIYYPNNYTEMIVFPRALGDNPNYKFYDATWSSKTRFFALIKDYGADTTWDLKPKKMLKFDIDNDNNISYVEYDWYIKGDYNSLLILSYGARHVYIYPIVDGIVIYFDKISFFFEIFFQV